METRSTTQDRVTKKPPISVSRTLQITLPADDGMEDDLKTAIKDASPPAASFE